MADPSIGADARCYSLSLNPFNFFPQNISNCGYTYTCLCVGCLQTVRRGSMSVVVINVYLCLAHIRHLNNC